MRRERHPGYRIDTPDQWPELGDLLRRRVEIIQKYADDDELRTEGLGERGRGANSAGRALFGFGSVVGRPYR